HAVAGAASDSGRGGGLFVEDVRADLMDVRLENNRADTAGPAYFKRGGLITLSNSPLVNNTLTGGGSAESIVQDMAGLLSTYSPAAVEGLHDFFSNFSTTLEDAFRKVNIPVIGDQLVQGVRPVFDSLNTFSTGVDDLLQDVFSLAERPGGPTLQELVQGA